MFPEEVISKKGNKREARILVERGIYTRYTYADPETGKIIKEGKESLFLKSNGKIEHFFIIPTSKNFLLIKEKETEESTRKRKIWDPKKKKAISIF